jgi:hypothetical protein
MPSIPYLDHIIVHLLQLLLGSTEGVRGGIELVGLEALVRESDFKELVIFLRNG